MTTEPLDRLIIGISGASGVQYGVRALELLKPLPIETHLIMSKSAELTVHHELDQSAEDIRALADVWHPVRNVGASVASGSFRTRGLLMAPCSIRTLGEITSGVTSSLLTRAADVVLKERRRLVLMVRETPLHLGHLRNMAAVTEMGAIVAPPVPAFYAKPDSLDAVITQSVSRALDLFDITLPETHRWTES
jgi:4-hydroxy-3-polyprenylbenzoate decarboxylase